MSQYLRMRNRRFLLAIHWAETGELPLEIKVITRGGGVVNVSTPGHPLAARKDFSGPTGLGRWDGLFSRSPQEKNKRIPNRKL
jgi:hypothetical protein